MGIVCGDERGRVGQDRPASMVHLGRKKGDGTVKPGRPVRYAQDTAVNQVGFSLKNQTRRMA